MCIGLTSIILTFTTNTMISGYGDLSVNKYTAQYKTVRGCSACDAINAVDRNISTCTQTDFGQTAPDQFTWWYVDLGAVHSVHNIRIQFRDYGQMYTMRQRGRFAGFSLYVSNSTDRQSKDLCYKDGPELPPLDFNTNCTKYGRYVIFYNERLIGIQYPVGYARSNVVNELCEVTVTDCSSFGVYGSHCDLPCPENCQERRCDIIKGTCFGCTLGWVGEYCTIGCSPGYYGLECKSKCIGHCKDNEHCNHINGLCDNGCYNGWTGEKCTEECPTGMFGSDCGYNCSGHCINDIPCDKTTGRCDSGCKPGYIGEFCDTGCKNGMYGRDCRYYCSGNCLHNVPCNSINGHCDSGCASGYLDVFCNKACDLGTYGLACKQNCSGDCKDGLCNNVDGSCICNGSPFCSDSDLSVNKNTAQYQTTRGCCCSLCDAINAVDRNLSTCTRTDFGHTAPDQITWWYVDLGAVHSVYNIRIQFRDYGDVYTMRQRGRFAGFSLYVSNSTDRQSKDLCYKDGPELPPLDFNTNCTKYGRYVIFYNERLNGIKYPVGYALSNVVNELCEVTVTDCSGFGVYGSHCDLLCPENCMERRCDIINGTCFGCTPGWVGEYCSIGCSFGYYGLECKSKCTGHCKDNEPCNHINGLCDNGCYDGLTGENCTEECPTGTFGSDCVYNCSGHCIDDIPCNRTTGMCDSGCKSGYTGKLCGTGCKNEMYGKDCITPCSGNCFNNVPCNSTNGHCDSGCASGYLDVFCNKKLESEKTGQDIEAVTGAVGAGVSLIVIVVIISYIVRQRRTQSKKADEREETMGFSAMGETLIKSKKQQADKTGTKNDIFKSETKTRSKGLISKESQNLNGLTKYLSEIKTTKMEEEYKAIPKGELYSCIEGKRQENKSKNRYTTIFPYDHSRVVLNASSSESNYINANYIEDVFGKKKYIAAQGPKDSTIADFWKMVWQENAQIIVCLTNISEAKTKKCAKYWPDLNDKHMEGDISVRCQKEQTYAENVVRHLRIKNNSENTERNVFMFHYTQWPDHGVPEPLSLVVFHRHVMKTVEDHPMGYIVVHCSAGIGRTGTFIALDALYKEGERTGKVNVPQYVEKMRNARMNMIQGEDQYKTVYMALLEAFRGRLRAVPVDFFLKEFQDHSCYLNHGDVSKQSPFALEFEELLSFRKVYTHEDYKSGMSNIAANYVPSVLPVERYLCPLTTENLYYNAVCLQSFTQCDRFISAQFPLPDYTEHFLTLVKTYYTCTIVSLYPLGEVKSTSLWLPTKNQLKTVGPFTIKLAESTQAKYVAKTNITLQQKGGSSMRVAVLECRGWEDEYDSKSRRILIDLVQEAKIEERTHPTGRILVLSSDGAKRCGPFCAVFNALEQMMMDEEVDLFTITRQLQTRRPEFLSSLEEYQFCFDTISDYLQNDTLYANI